MLLLTLLLAAAPLHPSPAGLYEIRQMEMAGGLELKKDGHFRYGFSYGAVDEEGQGDWTFDGKTVFLTSKPMPKAPAFELVRDDTAPKGELYVIEVNPLPGLTPGYSDLCLIASAAGIEYRTLIGEILEGGLKRLREKRREARTAISAAGAPAVGAAPALPANGNGNGNGGSNGGAASNNGNGNNNGGTPTTPTAGSAAAAAPLIPPVE